MPDHPLQQAFLFRPLENPALQEPPTYDRNGVTKKLLLIIILSFLWFGVTSLFAAEIPPHPEYSADYYTVHQNKATGRGKIYMGKNAVRLEMGKMIQILRVDKDLSWTLMPESNSYMEMKLQYNMLLNAKPEGFSEECLGGETIDGHPTKKCRLTGKIMGKSMTTTLWKAQDLAGTPIRNVNDEGSGTEMKNVVLGAQPAGLFEVPAGYKKIVLPVGMGDMMKEMTK